MLAKTPMMLQYQQIKEQYPDTIIFFRLGDFYEMFGKDAELASRVLEITLTGRDAGLPERVPMCGIPHHAADSYINKLIQKGYKVAICEQVEDPKKSKGIVKRDVIRVITPGTNLDPQIMKIKENSYLVALSQHQGTWGLAFCDISTGDFKVSEFTGLNCESVLQDELVRLNPSELLLNGECDPGFLRNNSRTIITKCDNRLFSFEKAKEMLFKHFKVTGLEALGLQDMRQTVICAGAVISYLLETQKSPPQQLKTIEIYHPDAFMMIDATTFRNLEIKRTIRRNERKGSLFDIMDRTKTAAGSRLLLNWLQWPLTEIAELKRRHNAVETLSGSWEIRHEIRSDLEKVYDLERLMTRILYLRAQPRELHALKDSLAVIPSIKTALATLKDSEYLDELTEKIDTLEDIRTLLERSIVADPPYTLKEGGVIKTGFNPEIDIQREASTHGKEWIARLETEEKEKTGIKSLKVSFNKVFGYYLEVTKANLSLVPERYQRKQTLSNSERYVTEELIRLENQVLGAEEKLLALEEDVYNSLLKELGLATDRIQHTSQILSQVDVLQSMAEIAVKNSYTRPQMIECDENILFFKDLRHPVVESIMSEPFVPNDLDMSKSTDLFIITGPNMGGKSTYCRSIALAVIMAQAGSFVPAQEAKISIRDKVFARVGASDDLMSGHSTFMVEMNEVANILRHATKYSLVVLDEVGRGTSTYDGLSMAWAVSEYLVKKLQPKTLFATHYHELTQLTDIFPNIKNLSLAVKEKGDDIIFLHRIINGPADKSYGIQVARLAGLPITVVSRAKEILRLLEKGQLGGNNPEDWPRKNEEETSGNIPEEICKVIEMIQDIDINRLTPLESINLLNQIIRQCEKLDT